MTRNSRRVAATAAAVALLSTPFLAAPVSAAENAELIAQGKAVAFGRSKGNCLACHVMADGESPGNVGPPLIAMKARYPDKAKLRAQIWDPMAANPETAMVPFGKYKILSESEIDALVEYIWTL